MMEETTVKTLAIVLVAGVALYAVYKMFEGNGLLSSISTPGSTTPNLTSIPGVPSYSGGAGAYASATPGALAASATSTLSEYAPAFGSGENTSSSDETDYDDLDFSDDDD
jgi:hypothetical protein